VLGFEGWVSFRCHDWKNYGRAEERRNASFRVVELLLDGKLKVFGIILLWKKVIVRADLSRCSVLSFIVHVLPHSDTTPMILLYIRAASHRYSRLLRASRILCVHPVAFSGTLI